MEASLKIAALLFAGIAVYFWWAGNQDGIFVALVLAACCYFLSMRFQIKARLNGLPVNDGDRDE